ncbi:MAG: hypothetical protein RIS70_419 [Planctomycetota bacterium]
MIRYCWLFLVMAAIVGESQTVLAHPGHTVQRASDAPRLDSTALRRWMTDDHATFEWGTFVMAREGMVQLRRADDSLVTIPYTKLRQEDRDFVAYRVAQIRDRSSKLVLVTQADRPPENADTKESPLIANHFDPFVKLKAIRTRWDDKFFYVESNGIPAHQMMVGITAWQQQVPIPQKYVGENAWRIPLHPVEAKTPAMAKDRFLRGAIALAVNGIPIFNPLNNRGDDAFLFGELDEFGGHCGRADDYHYHIAPIHLEKTVGKGNPIAYALDGYPIYGYQDPQAKDFGPLDALNGHKDGQGRYHYHATKAYPYLNGGFRGEVVEKEGQVDPQPRAEPLRPALPPLRDAKIVNFEELKAGSYRLTYEVRGKRGTVSYTLGDSGNADFEFVDPAGKRITETYTPRRRGRGEPKGPPRKEESGRKKDAGRKAEPAAKQVEQRPVLSVKSSSVDAKGMLSVDCTCDGKRQSPAVAWQDAPPGTKSFAISLWHTAPDQEKSYWVVYNIPATSTGFAQNAKPDGTVGTNDRRRAEFEPVCSKGPGLKTYHITVFALSKTLDLPPTKVTRSQLLEAIQGSVLAEGTLDVQYDRKEK